MGVPDDSVFCGTDCQNYQMIGNGGSCSNRQMVRR